LRRHGDDDVGGAIAVRVALDEPASAALIGAKLARRAAERAPSDPVERLVPRLAGIGVDQVQVDLVEASAPGRRLSGSPRVATS
jgi:hypothetical protein